MDVAGEVSRQGRALRALRGVTCRFALSCPALAPGPPASSVLLVAVVSESCTGLTVCLLVTAENWWKGNMLDLGLESLLQAKGGAS